MQMIVRRWIFPDAVHYCEFLIAVSKETYNSIDFLDGLARGRSDYWQIVFGNLFEKRPVRHVTTGHLHEIKSVLDNFVDGNLVPGRAHRTETGLNDCILYPSILVPGKARLREPLYVIEIVTSFVGRVNAAVNIAILELYAEVKWKTFRCTLEFTNNANAMFHVTHVVICHFIYEEWPPTDSLHIP